MVTITQIVDKTASDLGYASRLDIKDSSGAPFYSDAALLNWQYKDAAQIYQDILSNNSVQQNVILYLPARNVVIARQTIAFNNKLVENLQNIPLEKALTQEDFTRQANQARFNQVVQGIENEMASGQPVYYTAYQELASLASALGVSNPFEERGKVALDALVKVSSSREESLAKLSGSVNIPIVTLDAAGNLVTKYQVPTGTPTRSDVSIDDEVVGSAFTQPFVIADVPVYVTQGVDASGKTVQTILMPDKDGKIKTVGTIITKDGDPLRDDTIQKLIVKQLEQGASPEQAVKNIQDVFVPKQDNTLLYLAILAGAIAVGVTLFGKRKGLGKFFSTKGFIKQKVI